MFLRECGRCRRADGSPVRAWSCSWSVPSSASRRDTRRGGRTALGRPRGVRGRRRRLFGGVGPHRGDPAGRRPRPREPGAPDRARQRVLRRRGLGPRDRELREGAAQGAQGSPTCSRTWAPPTATAESSTSRSAYFQKARDNDPEHWQSLLNLVLVQAFDRKDSAAAQRAYDELRKLTRTCPTSMRRPTSWSKRAARSSSASSASWKRRWFERPVSSSVTAWRRTCSWRWTFSSEVADWPASEAKISRSAAVKARSRRATVSRPATPPWASGGESGEASAWIPSFTDSARRRIPRASDSAERTASAAPPSSPARARSSERAVPRRAP